MINNEMIAEVSEKQDSADMAVMLCPFQGLICIQQHCALYGVNTCSLAEISSTEVSDSIGVMESTLGEIAEVLRDIARVLDRSL